MEGEVLRPSKEPREIWGHGTGAGMGGAEGRESLEMRKQGLNAERETQDSQEKKQRGRRVKRREEARCDGSHL